MTVEWWEHHATVIQVARWMEERDRFIDESEVIDFFEKPWKWTPEYRHWVECELLDALARSEEHRT